MALQLPEEPSNLAGGGREDEQIMDGQSGEESEGNIPQQPRFQEVSDWESSDDEPWKEGDRLLPFGWVNASRASQDCSTWRRALGVDFVAQLGAMTMLRQQADCQPDWQIGRNIGISHVLLSWNQK